MRARVLSSLCLALSVWAILGAQDPPREWIEPATGHRVIRLSDQPETASLYFHQNPYTATGDKMVVSTREGLATIAFPSRTIAPLTQGRLDPGSPTRSGALGWTHLVVGRKTRQAFYIDNDTVYATDLDTRATRKILSHPRLRTGSGFGLSADETLLAGSFVLEDAPGFPPPANTAPPGVPAGSQDPALRTAAALPQNPLTTSPPQASSLEARWAARRPMALYTLNVKSGELNIIYKSTDWLNHVQMSPTDPTLIMYCHEGPWHKVDRIWTIRTDGSNRRLMHARTMEMEIAGHEFFSADGKTIWYDLQTPKSKEFWLAGVEIATGGATRYPVPREQWSVHFNVSWDDARFAGDGGGPRSVAAPGNGQWIYLFTPAGGTLTAERLVDLAKHDYQLEPNVTFTPDNKWIVFRSNMHGATHVYAVEVARTR